MTSAVDLPQPWQQAMLANRFPGAVQQDQCTEPHSKPASRRRRRARASAGGDPAGSVILDEAFGAGMEAIIASQQPAMDPAVLGLALDSSIVIEAKRQRPRTGSRVGASVPHATDSSIS